MSFLESLGVFASRPDLRSGTAIERDIDEELEAHLDLRTRDLIAAGMDPAAARNEAERRFGDRERIRGACRRTQMGERIMLQRLHVVVTVLLVPAVIWLGFVNWRQRQEAAEVIDQLHSERQGVLQLLLEKKEAAARLPEEIVVAIGDTIVLRSDLHPGELDVREEVAGDGTVLLPEVGHVPMFGLTRAAVEERLNELYAVYYERVDVRVQVLRPE